MSPEESPTPPSLREPPLSLEEVVRRDTEPGSGQIPRELLSPEGSRTVLAVGTDYDESPKVSAATPVSEGLTRLQLNVPVSVGIPGVTAERFPTAELAKPGVDQSEPSPRPDWADLAYLPRPSVPRRPKSLRRFKGRRVIPSQGCAAHIFNGESRAEYYPTGYPWHCIGKLHVWSNAANPSWDWVATGVLVGGNVVLTASHAFPWGSSSWKIWFVPAFYDGASTLGASVGSWAERGQGYSEHAQGNDMVVLKLYDRLGDSLGWFGSKQYVDDWEDQGVWTLCGYPCDLTLTNRPCYESGIAVVDDDSEGDALEIEHEGDEAKGESGGPFFAWWDNAPYVVGTHSGWEEEFEFPSTTSHSVEAGGRALVNLINWAHQNW